jgi:hypothetical protein
MSIHFQAVRKLNRALVIGMILPGYCATGPGPTIFEAFEKQYWRIDDRVGPEGEWKTNWTTWFESQEACVAVINETQRCRARRM